MNSSVHPDGPTVEELFALFPPADELPAYEVVPPEEVPSPYRDLLVHEHHMTVTMEAYHGDLVNVRILARAHQDDFYARKIVLTLQQTGRVVLFGIVRIDLHACGSAVAEAIVAGQTPLGRILIEHEVLRRIEPTAFLRIQPGPQQLHWFGLEFPTPLYGRLGIIHCDDKPAVGLLEVVIA